MKYYKVYGIYGMNESVLLFKAGPAQVSITFSGGSTAGMGITPAQFSTDNSVFQHIIEQSDHFISQRVKLLRCDIIEKDEPEESLGHKESSEVITKDEPEDAFQAEEIKNTDPLEEVEISCLADAKEYMATNFGYKKTSLKGVDSVHAAAAKHGIKFIGDLS